MTYDEYKETKFTVSRFDGVNAPLPDGLRCICVYIPDSDDAARVLANLISLPTAKTNWEGTEQQRFEQSQSWLQGYLMTEFNGCVDCQKVADCIDDPNSPANAAVRNVANASNGYPLNERLPDGYSNENLAAALNPSCDLDTLFGMCRFIVTTTNRLIVDFLERFEAATNIVDVGSSLAQLPVLDELGVDALIEYANFLLSVIAENYDAQYTQALEDELACGLFCAFKEDCAISIQGVAAYFADRVSLDFANYNAFEDLITAMLGVPLDGTKVVSAMFALCWIGVRVSNTALDGAGDSVLKIATKMGAGDPSDDWELLCGCSDIWEYVLSSATKPSWLTVQYGTLSLDTLSLVYPTSLFGHQWSAINIQWVFPTNVQLNEIRIDILSASRISGATIANNFLATRNPGGANIAAIVALVDGASVRTLECSAQLSKSGQMQYIGRQGSSPQPAAQFRLIFKGTGTNPFE